MREQMLEYGFDVYPVADGELHRFKGPDDKRHNGWYVYHGDHGAFGNWKTNLTVPWHDQTAKHVDKDELRKLIERERAERKREETVKHADAARQARSLWAQSVPTTEHPYLKRKQVQPHGIRVHEGRLVVPMTINTHIHSLQFITDDFKKFMPRGKVKGCYYPIGKLRERLWIAEGFATSASVFEATGDAVACAFSGVNMAKVAKSFRKQHPKLDIRIAGDVGGEKYTDEAMIACLGKRALPIFDDGDDGNDWNDFSCLYGKDTTRNALHGRI